MKEDLRNVRLLVQLVTRRRGGRALLAAALTLADGLALPVLAFALRDVVDAAAAGDSRRATAGAVVVAILWLASVALASIAFRFMWDSGELTLMAFNEELVDVAQSPSEIAHLESPALADRLETLRNEGYQIFWAYPGLMRTLSMVLQLGLSMVILASVQPWLFVLPLFAVPPLIASRIADRRVERGKDEAASDRRLARHYLELATDVGPAKEIRIFDLRDELPRRQRAAYDGAAAILGRADVTAGLIRLAGQLVFACGYGAALLLIVHDAANGTETVGNVLLAITLASTLNGQLSFVIASLQATQRGLLDMGRLRELRALAGVTEAAGTDTGEDPPESIVEGIRLDRVTFTYPDGDKPSLADVDLHLPGGAVVAIVGDNGAGKSTLVKLLCRLYEPSAGAISVDGVDVRAYNPDDWRKRVTAAFQDFQRFEVTAGENVGLGDLSRLDDVAGIERALDRAGSADLVATLPDGLVTHLGRSYREGHDLSGGQWQKLALGRGMMADAPLLLLLDEPASALDAHAEHALFELYMHRARTVSAETGAITLLVSHRFSTLRGADLIVVLDEGRVVESGSHAALMAQGGVYAELYEIQASAYR